MLNLVFLLAGGLAGARAVDPHFFLADQDPADFLNADSDPDPAALYMRIRTQIRIQQKIFCKTSLWRFVLVEKNIKSCL